jgi:prevent-host-death family protein
MTARVLPILPISDLRNKAKDILERVKEQPIIITQRGRPKAVLMDYEAYNKMIRMQEASEDARDALIIERALATSTGFVTFEELLKDYEKATGIKISLTEIAEVAKNV